MAAAMRGGLLDEVSLTSTAILHRSPLRRRTGSGCLCGWVHRRLAPAMREQSPIRLARSASFEPGLDLAGEWALRVLLLGERLSGELVCPGVLVWGQRPGQLEGDLAEED